MKTITGSALACLPRLWVELSLVVCLVTACAVPTATEMADKEYDKENELILAREDYERRRDQCESMRGVMTIPRFGTTARQEHTASEYKMAQCQR